MTSCCAAPPVSEIEGFRDTHDVNGSPRRSITLLQGTLAFSVHAPTVKLADPGAAMERAQELGTLRVDTEGYQKAAAAAFRETGELLPGVEAVPERETFAARFPREGGAGAE